MKKPMAVLAVSVALLGVATPSQAWWHGWYGYPYPYPYWYPPPAPYVYVPPVVAPPAQPPAYPQQQSQQQYWYWCQDVKGYFPYVQQCPSGWMQVLPQTTPPVGPR